MGLDQVSPCDIGRRRKHNSNKYNSSITNRTRFEVFDQREQDELFVKKINARINVNENIDAVRTKCEPLVENFAIFFSTRLVDAKHQNLNLRPFCV